MTASSLLVLLTAFLFIALASFSFFSIPWITLRLRARGNYLLDLQMFLISCVFYAALFYGVRVLFFLLEEDALHGISRSQEGFLCGSVALLLYVLARITTGDLVLNQPPVYAQKVLPIATDFTQTWTVFLELLKECKGTIILDALDKKMIIAHIPSTVFGGDLSQQALMVECTFSETFLHTSKVQIVCAPAVRGTFIEKQTLQVMLATLTQKYREKVVALAT